MPRGLGYMLAGGPTGPPVYDCPAGQMCFEPDGETQMDPLSALIPVTTSPLVGQQVLCPDGSSVTYPASCPSMQSVIQNAAGSGGAILAAPPAPTAVVSSTAGASAGSTATPAAAACSLAWFGDTSCITLGSTTIGTTTALALAWALAVGLLFMFGGKR
jgi:hypothetical protein